MKTAVRPSRAPASRRRRTVRALIILLAIPCVLYMAVLAYLYFNQRALIFPGSMDQGKAETRLVAPPDSELVSLPTPQGNVAALFSHALLPDGGRDPHASSRPTLLYFYGNGGSVKYSLDQIQHFQRLGLNVLVPDYLGFGMSGGKASEAGCYLASEAAYNYLLTRRDIDPSKIVFTGWSLGSAMAIDLATRRPCAALMTFSAFTSMAEMGNSQYPIVPLPVVRIILKYRFPSEDKIRRVHCPVLIGHSRGDRFIPYTMSDRLAAASGGPVTRLTTQTSDHGDFFVADESLVYGSVDKFLRQTVH